MTHAIVLRIPVNPEGHKASLLTDAMGEFARNLEADEADENQPNVGLVPDDDDPGRFAWSIVHESYA